MKRSLSKCLLALSALIGTAQGVCAAQSTNIVIGNGCASTCINGKCESTCDGKASNNAEQLDDIAESREFSFRDFERIRVADLDIEIRQADDYSVVVTDGKQALEHISVELVSGQDKAEQTLAISVSRNYFSRTGGKVVILTPILRSVNAVGNASVAVSGFDQGSIELFTTDNASMEISNSRFSELSLSANRNTEVIMAEASIGGAEVEIGDQADVTLNFSGFDNAQIVGRVDGMADLEICGNPDQNLTVSDMADAVQNQCKS